MPSEGKSQTMESSPWFVYILRCADNSLYTGVTTDVEKRLKQHNGIEKNGAKYTRARQPVELVYREHSESRAAACKREHTIKSLKKSEKEYLIAQHSRIETL
jgi:putative endonuclease